MCVCVCVCVCVSVCGVYKCVCVCVEYTRVGMPMVFKTSDIHFNNRSARYFVTL